MFRTAITVIAITMLLAAAPAAAQTPEDWYMATGTICGSVDLTAAKSVEVKTDLYNRATMISPDSAKLLALCAVPGGSAPGRCI